MYFAYHQLSDLSLLQLLGTEGVGASHLLQQMSFGRFFHPHGLLGAIGRYERGSWHRCARSKDAMKPMVSD